LSQLEQEFHSTKLLGSSETNMIITAFVYVKIVASNVKHWRDLGYVFPNPSARWGIVPKIQVKVSELKVNSNVRVECKCDECGMRYSNRFSRHVDVCNKCFASNKMKGNNLGFGHSKGKGLSGSDHPRWNPNSPAFKKYSRKVHWLTSKVYKEHAFKINPHNHPRTLCGVKNGWQLDHIVSIKEGFEKGLSPETIADINNLQMLPWQDNLAKRAA
jgi:ribosomal protein L37AE/L43A